VNKSGRCCDRRESGVTLLELAISLTILGLLLPVIAEGLSVVIGEWNRAVDRLEARQQAMMLLQRIERDVRDGRMFTAQSDGLLFLSANDQVIRYHLSPSGQLLRDEAGVGTSVIGAKLRSIRFLPESGGALLRLRMTTAVGQAEVSVDQLLAGRVPLP
jgi:prepilin-type N-terminal cleavage/methylation domain-containing protein